MMDPRLHFVDLHQKQKNNNCLLILLTTFILLAPQRLKKKVLKVTRSSYTTRCNAGPFWIPTRTQLPIDV